ncbi:MAG: FliM/FliN family flagellar motor switch protein, partial [Vicinamibacterales bacterium]
IRLGLSLGETTVQVGAQVALEVAAGAQPTAASPASRKIAAAGPNAPSNLDVVLDIELPLSVRFGSTVMSIRALSAIGPGSIVDMGRSPDDPVEILVCGRPIARAEVVVVGGNYGVRITDLTSATERIRAMEGQL